MSTQDHLPAVLAERERCCASICVGCQLAEPLRWAGFHQRWVHEIPGCEPYTCFAERMRPMPEERERREGGE